MHNPAPSSVCQGSSGETPPNFWKWVDGDSAYRPRGWRFPEGQQSLPGDASVCTLDASSNLCATVSCLGPSAQAGEIIRTECHDRRRAKTLLLAPSHSHFHPIHNKSKARDTTAISATGVHGQVTNHSTNGGNSGAGVAVGVAEGPPAPVAVGIQWRRETTKGLWRGGLVPTKRGTFVGFGVFVAVGVGVEVTV